MAYFLPSWPFVLTSWHKVGNLQYFFITPLLIEWPPGLLPGGFSFCLDTVPGAVSYGILYHLFRPFAHTRGGE